MELEHLLERLKKGSSRYKLVRNLLICKLHEEGILPPANIAEITSTSTTTVLKVIKNEDSTLKIQGRFYTLHNLDIFVVGYMEDRSKILTTRHLQAELL